MNLSIKTDLLEFLKRNLRIEYSEDHMPDNTKPASVMIAIINRTPSITVLLTRRSETIDKHKGQVAFPGGVYDVTHDSSLIETALRELYEETGLQSSHIEIYGNLSPYTTITNYWVVPFVGWIQNPPDSYHFSEKEVAKVFEVPISFLLNPANHEIREIEYLSVMRQIHYYYYEDEIIWGATGHMLSELLNLIEKCC